MLSIHSDSVFWFCISSVSQRQFITHHYLVILLQDILWEPVSDDVLYIITEEEWDSSLNTYIFQELYDPLPFQTYTGSLS